MNMFYKILKINSWLFCLLFLGNSWAQVKGVKPVASPFVAQRMANTASRAVVIGISDYQDEAIEDLKYADKDAVVFADFLRSPSGGSLNDQQIRVLTNGQATLASVQSALEWLLKNSQKGDLAIIYFSCHGDVEAKAQQERGYLLTHDTPKNNYRLNALDVDYLNDHIIGGLSKLDVKTIVVMDACHSGTLAGEGIGGKESTASELMKRFSNEVKIMSCQPYELSLEGSQWGNGRGLFSFYLIDGLRGRADEDGDKRVDLYELEAYLQHQIRKASKKSQHPDIFGGRKQESMFAVDEKTLADEKAKAQEHIRQDLEQDVLGKLASREGFEHYLRFNEALDAGYLLLPPGQSAAHYYELLYADTAFIPLRGIMDERLVTMLMDSVQQAIVAYLSTDPDELRLRDRFDTKYSRFSDYLKKAAEILGPKDSRYKQTLAKQYYFEGLALRLAADQAGGDTSLYRQASVKQREAIALEGRAAYMHNELGLLLPELGEYEEGMAALEKAIEISPTWAIPYNNVATEYKRQERMEEAEQQYQKAIALKPDLASAYVNLANLYSEIDKLNEAIVLYQRAIALNPAEASHYFYLGLLLSGIEGREREAEEMYLKALKIRPKEPEIYLELGNLYDGMNLPDSTEKYYRQAIALDTNYAKAYLNLGIYYYLHNQTDEAEKALLSAIRCDSALVGAYSSLITVYKDNWPKISALLKSLPFDTALKVAFIQQTGYTAFLQQKAEDAIRTLYLAIEVNPADPWTYFLLCTIYAAQGQERKALDLLEKSLERAKLTGENYFEVIDKDENLKALKTEKRYKTLMQRFFADK
jgi:tetratricopeptide (TPR) repeat protein